MLDLGGYSYDQLTAMEDLLVDLRSHPYLTSPNGVDAGIIRMWLRMKSKSINRAICARLDIEAEEFEDETK